MNVDPKGKCCNQKEGEVAFFLVFVFLFLLECMCDGI